MDLTLYTNFAASVAQQEQQINVLQQQISTGYAVQSPDQGPAAYQTASFATDQIGTLNADNTTQATIQNQLGNVGGVYTSVSNLYDNVQSVLEQALNGSTNTDDLHALSGQVASAATQLVGLSNTTGSNGQYLFGGSRGNVAPFQIAPDSTVVYIGDGAQSQASIAPGDNVPILNNGDVFVAGLSGDGTASVTAAPANAGSATLNGQVYNPSLAAAFQTHNTPITLTFSTSATGLIYTATSAGSTIATGAANGGGSIQLAGEDFTLTGTPAAGDSFTISPSRPQTAFALLTGIAGALAAASVGSAPAAQTRQVLNQSLSALAQYQQLTVTSQAQNGVTLQAVSNAVTGNANQSTALQGSVQSAVGANIPSAITNLDQSVSALQAALKAFASVQSLSLFSYI